MTKIKTREQLLKVSRKKVKVYVPLWKSTVYVKELSAKQLDLYRGFLIASGFQLERFQKKEISYEQLMESIVSPTKLAATVISWSVVDEEGEQIFLPEDIEKLEESSVEVLKLLFDTARDLSGLNKIEKEGGVEEVKADLKNAPKESSN